MKMRSFACIGALALAACSADVPNQAPVAPARTAQPAAIAPAAAPASPAATPTSAAPSRTAPPADRPGVRVAADPPPPFTYWAPAGSVIRNHGNPGLWVAEVNGRQTGHIYFGDQCKASEHQGLVGQPVRSLPQPPPANWRISCETCPVTQDLRPDRMNVKFDRNDIVTEVSCG